MNIKSILFLLLLNLVAIRGDDSPTATRKCGPTYGNCPGNYCCSKDGKCGTSNDYCNVTKGCQVEYGLCYEDTDDSKQCGKDKGVCASGRCCSKYGYCGTNDNYCNIANGCQMDYGLCYSEDKGDSTKCGPGVGTCPNNLCCSLQGNCGISDEHCSVSKGCQLSYGLCYDSPENETPVHKCGPNIGSCPNNLCCSMQDSCGSTDDYCDIKKGCQLSYGLCYESPEDDTPTTEHKCGPNIGICPDNLCCSSQNVCGKTDEHCNVLKGCQNAYGLCYENDDKNDDDDDEIIFKECGPGFGRCTQEKCCSKDGECGTDDSYCNIKRGCQVDYGLCYNPAGSIREGSGRSCGRNYGSCEFPECCSKSGKCVYGNDQCLETNGCQNSYGLCLSQP